MTAHPIIAVAGLAFEARAAHGPNVTVIYGQDRARLIGRLEQLARQGARGIISFGTAGGLAPSYRPGDVIVAASIVIDSGRYPTSARWSRSLLEALPFARYADLLGVDAPILTPSHKASLWTSSGAAAVDMESHIAARVAASHGLPFAALRVIIDPAHRSVPAAALAGVRPNGETDATAVLAVLRKEPSQLRALLRLARDARRAKRSLLRCREALGPFFGFLDAGELALNMH